MSFLNLLVVAKGKLKNKSANIKMMWFEYEIGKKTVTSVTCMKKKKKKMFVYLVNPAKNTTITA